jgi:adenosylhomocysteine nucleosidase
MTSRVALLAPMKPELKPLVRKLLLQRDGELHVGRAGDVEVVATLIGIGLRAATDATERLLDTTEVDHAVVVGIAGGVGAGLEIGDVVVPERVVDAVSGAEFRPAPLRGVDVGGALLTTDGLIVDDDLIADHVARGVVALDMEASAVATVCERRGCAWSVVRAISDRPRDGMVDEAVFGLAGPDGSANLGALARFVATKPTRVRHLARLARDMNTATNAAADVAIAAIAHI